MNLRFLFIFISYSTLLRCSKSANILGVFPLAGRSINILYNKLMVSLANAGHDVTLISAHPPKGKIQNGTVRHINLPGFWENYDALIDAFDPWSITEGSDIFQTAHYTDFVMDIFDKTFRIPEVKKLSNSNEHFDALIMDDVWIDCFKIFGQIFDCPVIMFSSFGGNIPSLNADVGNPLPPSYIPHFNLIGPNFGGMSFYYRLKNLIFYVVDSYIRYFYALPIHTALLKSHFKNPPDVTTFYNNISLVLLGSHPSIRQSSPTIPNIVDIGGFHIEPPKKLPKDLQDFLDEAIDGAIYFSLGSHVNSKDMPPGTMKMFLDVFKKLKQRVLWKFEEDLPGKPENVFIRKWLPQTDILAHPNIKLFITHGGQGSFLETVYHGVPCLMVPVFFDQYHNAYQAVQIGIALKIAYNKENESTLTYAIKELLDNPKYKNNAKLRQKLFHDRPMKALAVAVYWIEYVIRHKGADHLKVQGVNMPWYQFYCVDVIIFFLAVFSVNIYFLHLLLGKLYGYARIFVGKEKIL